MEPKKFSLSPLCEPVEAGGDDPIETGCFEANLSVSWL